MLKTSRTNKMFRSNACSSANANERKHESFFFLFDLSLSSQVTGKWPRILVGPIWKCVSFEQYVNDSDPSESCSVA